MMDAKKLAAALVTNVRRGIIRHFAGRVLSDEEWKVANEALEILVEAVAAADAEAWQWHRLDEMATVPVGRRWRVVLEAKPDAVERYRFNYGCDSSSVIPVDMELYAIAGKLGDVYEARLEVETDHLSEPPR